MLKTIGSVIFILFLIPFLYLFITGPILLIACDGWRSILMKNDGLGYCMKLTDRFQGAP